MARSYYAWYQSKNSRPLIGGVMKSQSSRFGDRKDAETRLEQTIEINGGPDQVEGGIYESDLYPEIFSHCLGTPAQAINGKCFGCSVILTEKVARTWNPNSEEPAELEISNLRIIKGCPSLSYNKDDKLTDVYVRHEGKCCYRVSFIHHGKRKSLSARLVKHNEFNMNNGDPTKNVRVIKEN